MYYFFRWEVHHPRTRSLHAVFSLLKMAHCLIIARRSRLVREVCPKPAHLRCQHRLLPLAQASARRPRPFSFFQGAPKYVHFCPLCANQLLLLRVTDVSGHIICDVAHVVDDRDAVAIAVIDAATVCANTRLRPCVFVIRVFFLRPTINRHGQINRVLHLHSSFAFARFHRVLLVLSKPREYNKRWQATPEHTKSVCLPWRHAALWCGS